MYALVFVDRILHYFTTSFGTFLHIYAACLYMLSNVFTLLFKYFITKPYLYRQLTFPQAKVSAFYVAGI